MCGARNVGTFHLSPSLEVVFCFFSKSLNVLLGPDSAQLVCSHCRMLLVYPRGAGMVQCSICQTLNPANQVSKRQKTQKNAMFLGF